MAEPSAAISPLRPATVPRAGKAGRGTPLILSPALLPAPSRLTYQPERVGARHVRSSP